jgi:hypothetical protein
MINRLIGGFVAILVGVSLIGPMATQVQGASSATNATGAACTWAIDQNYAPCQLFFSASWGATVLKMVPGFFALGIMGIGIAITYGSLRDAGVV